MNEVFFVGGNKGGVGKSFFSTALIDFKRNFRKENVFFIETERSNPDVYEAVSKVCPSKFVDMTDLDDWPKLLEMINSHPDEVIVINSEAAMAPILAQFMPIFDDTMRQLNRRFVTPWVMNTDKDSLGLLFDHLEQTSYAEVHPVLNLHHGLKHKFSHYLGSKVEKMVQERGGKNVVLPVLTPMIARELNAQKWAIEVAIENTTFGNKILLESWRKNAWKVIEEIA